MKLRYKLSFLFLVVITIATGMTLAVVGQSTVSLFRSFVFEGDAEKAKAYAGILAGYRTGRGTWDDAQTFILELPDLLYRQIDTEIYGDENWSGVMKHPALMLRSLISDRVVVADANGLIVADTAGELLGTLHPARHIGHGVPIMANFERVGTVLVGSMVESSLSGADERFLVSVMRSLFWSTAVSMVLAIVLGIIFTARITKPLGILATGARRVASGDLSSPVPIVGHDELTELSLSFNEMTTELKRLEAAKKQVIADSAHELRTPVTLIQGTIEGMIDGIFPLDIPTLESVHEETLRLSRLIDTLRELEIIESGELSLSLEGVDIGDMIRKALPLFWSSSISKSISIFHENPSGKQLVANGDRLRLGEVIYNLLSNAIKYTPVGGTVRMVESEGPEGFVQFSVEDSGPGIPPEERTRIFERFYRMDHSRSSATGGRGLGLAIASEIVKAHGGSITIADSSLGGASFVVKLPRFSSC